MAIPYPPVGFYFKVVFTNSSGDFSSETSFKEVSGLSVDTSPEEIGEGGVLNYKHRLPTTYKYTNLVLKRGLITDSKLRKWVEKGVNEFSFTPLTVTIQLLGAPKTEGGDPQILMTWTAHNVWPVKWDVARFDSQANEVAVESIELAFSYFEAS